MLDYVGACNSLVQARALLESSGTPHYSIYTLALSEPFAADIELKRPMRILKTEPSQLNIAQLHELIGSLEHSKKDFETRLARQVAALERLDAMHANNPVYQALFFLLRNITERLSRAEGELSRRASGARG
jgi:hypothetical protein